jgi:iron complex transport system substrate-binding protein
MRMVTAVVLAALSAAPACGADADAPRRIVSFNVCADQIVIALADPGQIVALSPYASDPQSSVLADAARAYPRLRLQAETLVPYKPDLVLVGTWDRPLTQRMLRGLGFRVVGVDIVQSFDAARAQVRDIAALIGQRARGEKLVADIDAALRRLEQTPRPASSSALLIGNAGYAAGRDSLASALLAAAGLNPPSAMPQAYGGYVPLEKLIELRPDYLVMARTVARPDGQGALYLAHPALRALYPPSRRIILPSRYTVCGGPAVVEALNYLAGVVARLAPSP